MRTGLRLIAPLLATVLLAACSSNKNDDQPPPELGPVELYQQAEDALQRGDFVQATNLLESLDTRYPFGPHTTQVQLALIFSYYKNGDYDKGTATIDRFTRLNPTHPDIDYAYYIRGLNNMAADHSFLHTMFNIDRSDRDKTYSMQAYRDFNRLLRRYPESPYAPDAHARMVYLKERLAKHELAAADYYLRRGAWVASVNRANFILENFPDTSAKTRALEIMVEAYGKLDQPEQQERARQVLAANR